MFAFYILTYCTVRSLLIYVSDLWRSTYTSASHHIRVRVLRSEFPCFQHLQLLIYHIIILHYENDIKNVEETSSLPLALALAIIFFFFCDFVIAASQFNDSHVALCRLLRSSTKTMWSVCIYIRIALIRIFRVDFGRREHHVCHLCWLVEYEFYLRQREFVPRPLTGIFVYFL